MVRKDNNIRTEFISVAELRYNMYRNMKNKFFLLIASVICILMIGSCENDDLPYDPIPTEDQDDITVVVPTGAHVDMTIVVPIHPSTLKYFDYVVHYQDSQGLEHNDTIRENTGGIVVDNGVHYEDNQGLEHNDIIREKSGEIVAEEWNYTEHEVTGVMIGTSLYGDDYYTRTFRYDNLPITSSVTVKMIPKKDISTKASFIFVSPKPYIFPSVHFSTTSVSEEIPYRILDNAERTRIDDINISSFQMVYGKSFSTHCEVCTSLDGYNIFVY